MMISRDLSVYFQGLSHDHSSRSYPELKHHIFSENSNVVGRCLVEGRVRLSPGSTLSSSFSKGSCRALFLSELLALSSREPLYSVTSNLWGHTKSLIQPLRSNRDLIYWQTIKDIQARDPFILISGWSSMSRFNLKFSWRGFLRNFIRMRSELSAKCLVFSCCFFF